MTTATFERALVEGRALFEQGSFFAAHEAFEEGWKLAHGDERKVLQVLVLWSAALHKHGRGEQKGASLLLENALERVGSVAEAFDGLEVDELREALVTSLEAVKHPNEPHAPHAPQFPHEPEAAPEAEQDVELEHRMRCPYCAEPVLVAVAPEDSHQARYVEDCPVCCRPWQVEVTQGRVSIERDEAQE